MAGTTCWPRVSTLAASSAGDVDGDGLGDFLLGDPGLSVDRPAGMVFLAMSADLGTVDRVDGCTDSRLLLAHFPGDADADGFPNPVDRDDDGDGIGDASDLFPNDAARSDLMSYRIVLDAADEGAETSATIAGDLDRDGSPERVIASPTASATARSRSSARSPKQGPGF